MDIGLGKSLVSFQISIDSKTSWIASEITFSSFIFMKVKKLLGYDANVDRIVSDFELALWNAVRAELPNAIMQGCSFHWGQAVWQHVSTFKST